MFSRHSLRFLVVTLLAVGPLADGAPRSGGAKAKPARAEPEAISFNDFTSQFTVKISGRSANIFSAHPSSWHGTGILAEIRKNSKGEMVGVIWTNDHVVGSDQIQVRELTVAFSTDTNVPEVVKAEVVYQSQLLDFAVLEFPMAELKRSIHRIRPARFPSPDSPFYRFVENQRDLQGVDTLAQGNPFDSENIITFGKITGSWTSVSQGTYIQTQTPINPGNSGGPLIELKTGLVIGINSAGIPGASNVGYAIPIGGVIDEYNEWRRNPAIARARQLKVQWAQSKDSDIENSGAAKVITAKYPDFFHHYSNTIRVEDADPATQLKTGDQVIKVNGEFTGASVYRISRQIQFANLESVPFEVLRDGKLIEILVPIEDVSYQAKRRRLDYVYIAGLIFREVGDVPLWLVDHTLESKVMILMMLPTPVVNFHGATLPDRHSILVGVNVEGKNYEVKRLRDLRAAIGKHPGAKSIRLIVREPLYVVDEDGTKSPHVDANGHLHFSATTTGYDLPLMEVLTPKEVSLHRFAQQFSFKPERWDTRDWRNFKCDKILAPK